MSSTTSAKKRKYLSLKQKVEVIKTMEKTPGMKTRELSRIFDCGKTQIGKIIKNKDSILSMYEANVSQTAKYDSKMSRISEYTEINKALYEWYTLACSKNIYPRGATDS